MISWLPGELQLAPVTTNSALPYIINFSMKHWNNTVTDFHHDYIHFIFSNICNASFLYKKLFLQNLKPLRKSLALEFISF